MRQREERLMKMAATENGDCVIFFIVFSLQIVLKVAYSIGMVLEFCSGSSDATGLYQHTFSKNF